MSGNIDEFVAQLDGWVYERAVKEGGTVHDAFVDVVSEALLEDGRLDNPETCFFRKRRQNKELEVAGYDISTDESVLRLLAAHHGDPTVRRSHLDDLVGYALNFAEACQDGLADDIEPASPPADMVLRIRETWPRLERVQVIVLTDGTTNTSAPHPPDLTIAGLPVTVQIWDRVRLYRLMGPSRLHEEIVVDLKEMGYEIPCLETPRRDNEYACVLAVLPAKLVAELYDQHHSRLLQRNVRAFLQARTKVNRGIAETIKEQPGRFLAYNNGISATATRMEIEAGPDGRKIIRRIWDPQIVNGGQTTASLHVQLRAGADLSNVHVAAKFTVVDGELLDELVPKISKYANSQNAVTAADFEGNSPYHVEMERHSRSIWTPLTDDGTRQTHWYYERVRGQYDVDRARLPTRSKQREFDLDNPKKQKITKTDAAKYEFAYRGRPEIVSLGAQKCFQEWSKEGDPATVDTPPAAAFRDLVAKCILFNRTRKIVQGLGYSGYLANVTAYSVALLVHRLGGELDLAKIWRLQAVPEVLEAAVPDLAMAVRAVIVNPPGHKNVTEWCKKPDCWEKVKKVSWQPSAALVKALAVTPADAA